MSRQFDDAVFLSMERENEEQRELIAKKFSKLLDGRSLEEGVANDIFYQMMQEYPKKLFEIVYVMSEESDHKVEKIFKYLDQDNKGKLKSYAMNFYNTTYYEKKEIEKKRKKMEKKGKKFDMRKNIEDLFE
jgi:hypothetical protein